MSAFGKKTDGGILGYANVGNDRTARAEMLDSYVKIVGL